MKKVILSTLLSITGLLAAQEASPLADIYRALSIEQQAIEQRVISDDCRKMQQALNAPYYYCECKEEAYAFAFPLEQIVADTTWYSAGMPDLQQGITAYWFAECSVTLEVYPFCSSKSPIIKMTIAPDQMREYDPKEINEMIEDMGDMGGAIIELLEPHIRVYTKDKGAGKVYCYPFNQGPHSTCEAPLPVRTTMTYVSSHADDVYEWQADRLPESGQVYVQWKEKKNMPCTLRITRGSCSGETIMQMSLADSTKLCFPDSEVVREAKEAGESLFFHFTHQSDHVGRIRFRTDPLFIEQVVDTTICQGRGLQLADTLLTESTRYTNDTVWHAADSVYIRAYDLTIAPPMAQPDTLRVTTSDLPLYYRNEYFIPKDGFGDYDVLLHFEDACDERYALHVAHKTITRHVEIDSTLCEGRIFTYEGQEYTRDTTFQTIIETHVDTLQITDIRLTFEPPTEEYDTLVLTEQELQYGYLYEPANQLIYDYGDYHFLVERRNTCTRLILLTVEPTDMPSHLPNTEHRKTSYLYRDTDGTIYIVRDGCRYTLLGQRVAG